MSRVSKTPIQLWALSSLGLLACGAQAGNNGGATNWLECNVDSDCRSGSCVERRCEPADAATPAISSNSIETSPSTSEAGTALPQSDPTSTNADPTGEPNDSDPDDSAQASSPDDAAAATTRPNPNARPVELALGEEHGCARFDDGSVWCWGGNELGQLGDGSFEPSLSLVNTGLTDVTYVAAGRNHTCALTSGGVVWCWGNDSAGQLGQSANEESDPKPDPGIPVRVPIGPAVNDRLYAGGDASCVVALGLSHTRCWGTDPSGTLYPPQQLPQIGLSAEEVIGNLVLTTRDFVFTNYEGQVLRIADWSSDVTPDPDIGTATSWMVSDGERECRVKADDSVWCRDEEGVYLWQPNLLGPNITLGNDFLCSELGTVSQCLGNNPAIPAAPTQIEGLRDVYAADAQGNHACAIGVEGSIWCWGSRAIGTDVAAYVVHESALTPKFVQRPELSPTTGDDYVNAAIARSQRDCRCEADEPASCYADSVQLTTGRCIDALRWLEGLSCARQEEWDQANSACDAEPPSTCTLPEATPWIDLCVGNDKQCPGGDVTFAGTQWCDGTPDCPDGFDELNCIAASTYTCADAETVAIELVCDAQLDCPDGSDELNCE